MCRRKKQREREKKKRTSEYITTIGECVWCCTFNIDKSFYYWLVLHRRWILNGYDVINVIEILGQRLPVACIDPCMSAKRSVSG